MAGPLNLAGADMKGFDAVEAGRYRAEIFEMSWDAVKNTDGTGKTPAGTPMLKVQFRLLENSEGVSDGIENRRVFASYVVPPKDYDAAKAARMKGMIARFFVALGFSEEEVLHKDFDPDFDDLVGKEVVVTVKKEQKKTRAGDPIEGEYNNPVSGVKSIDTWTGATSGSVL